MSKNVYRFTMGLLAIVAGHWHAGTQISQARDYHYPTAGNVVAAPNYNTTAKSSVANLAGNNDSTDVLSAGDWDGTCNTCERKFFAGVEATFLQPNIRGRQSIFIVNDTAGPTTNRYLGGSAEEFNASPRLWLGRQGENWGLLFRFWEMNSSETAFSPFGGVSGSTAFERLDAYTIDLEVTRRFCRNNRHMTVSFGARYAEIDNQNFSSASEIVTSGDLYTGNAMSENHIGATGLTFGMTSARQFRDTSWDVFFNARGSILWGETRHQVEALSAVSGPSGTAAALNNAVALVDESLFIGEIQWGLQREMQLQCINATAFFRAVMEYQYWDTDNSGGANATSTAAVAGSSADATAAAGDLRVDLIGFAISTGFYW